MASQVRSRRDFLPNEPFGIFLILTNRFYVVCPLVWWSHFLTSHNQSHCSCPFPPLLSSLQEDTNTDSMHFCPMCSNLLLIEDGLSGMRFCCPTCPYTHDITKTYSSRVKLTRKEVDDVLGGADAWENVDRTETVCPACAHTTAYFMQMQIRSADEPSTIFYKCVNCSTQWND